MAASTAKIDLIFRVNTFGWSEPYYHALADGASLSSLDKTVQQLAQKRMALCGGGVTLEEARLSDVAVRRDSDVIPLSYFTFANASEPQEATPTGGLLITPALTTAALIPNVAIVVRVEAENKVYHSAHYLSGIPRNMVGGDDRLIPFAAWNTARLAFEKFLTDNLFLFPNLDRAGKNADRPIISWDKDTLIIGADTTNWATGDRVRLINWIKPKTESLRSVVGTIEKLVPPNTFKYANGDPGPTWKIGPKSIAHREETIYVPITDYLPERVSHRNRGRPSDSPRGRRKR